MYFKQLEMVGFKSFPRKTKLKFEPGITAVVGPNGCGKSNIADAIKWVLGEQSPKSLRGSSMEDVIFTGTDSAEPINMAEVSLTLSNEDKALPIDYEEVTITRRLFRSGESEYLLNKTPVRLKDITNLLMGTGLGTSSYYIIEQGRIGLILSTKPEDKRQLFEEASGITRYKAKKTEALRKLEHTENNLVRINDIINEVKRQISSIERHAKKAERYKVDFDAMKEMDLKLTAYELKNINSSLEKNKESTSAFRERENGLTLEINDTTEIINKRRMELETILQSLADAQKKLSEATLFIDKSTHKVMLDRERMEDLRSLQIKLKEETEALGKKLRTQEEDIAKIRERFENASKNRKDKEAALSQREGFVKNLSMEIEEHQKEIREAKDRTVNLLAVQTKLKNELIKLGADLTNRKSRMHRLVGEKEKLNKEKSEIELSLGKADNELKAYTDKVKEMEHALGGFKNNLNAREEALEEVRARIAQNGNNINSLKSKEDILREMIENFEGFDNGVKLIMDGAKNGSIKGVMGVVADMLEPEDGYDTALEIALSKKAQAVVLEDSKYIEEALAYLRSRNASAHFIIYGDIVDKTGDVMYESVMREKYINALSSFIRSNTAYKPLADYLLGDVFVIEKRDAEGHNFYKKMQEKGIKFVTKDGIFTERGHVFGNFLKNEVVTSIIGRTRRLEQIAAEREKLIAYGGLLKEEEAQCKLSINDLKNDIKSAEEALKKEEICCANALARKKTVEENLGRINDESAIIELEIGEVNELISDISLKGDEFNKQLNENESEYANQGVFISATQEAVQNKAKAKNDYIIEISEMKSEIGFLNSTEEQEAKNLEKEVKISDELKTQHDSKNRDIQNSAEKEAFLVAETDSLEKKIESVKMEESGLKDELEAITDKKMTISQDLKERESAYRASEKEAEGLRDNIRNLEIKIREAELTVVNIKDRVRQAYKLNTEELNLEVDEAVNWEDMRNQVEVLRIKLEKLGPVNLVAIEELKDLQERYTFLTQQQDDLLKAKESLHKAIITINKTTRKLFSETFQKVQVEFRNYFRMLFGGGHAELILLDESDILECGIEIVVRPPGKKLQNLLLLSGGEKALTAIALLLSIFKVKPSPFCILDEVDAPLDESNIGRFTRILHDFLKTSQFIVITHSKRTMEMANVLYGITMEEKGISKIVSVKFTEDDGKNVSEKEEVLI
ncbi:MAG: chromosome segregation protein SMC [Candidatus Omnitrophica bacterium]|nr:chromosome segregation protein SMC [Candidatus Omnitrophota bacterium]